MVKKKTNKRFTQKVHKVVKSDLFTSVAIASLLLNIFFVVGLVVLTNPDTYNREVYENVRARYCKNIDGLVDDAEETGNGAQVLAQWKITCVSKEFLPYYKEALKKFNAGSND